MSRTHVLGGLLTMLVSATLPAEELDLSGTWQVSLDRADRGEAERWFDRRLAQPIELPGSLQTARIGDPITAETAWTGGIFDRSWFTAPDYAEYRRPGNVKVPFWLQPETHYVGAAWYQREIEVPRTWAGRRVTLTLERPHWATTVWVDDRRIGAQDANSTAHTYDLGAALGPGRHRLTVRVDNRLVPDIGENSHSVSDHTQGNWNGIVGRIVLTATAPVWIENFRIDARVADRMAKVTGELGRVAGQGFPGQVELRGSDGRTMSVAVGAEGRFSAEYRFPADAPLWDEFSPALHSLTVALPNGEKRSVRFGIREIAAQGRQLLINGRKLFLRGTLDCAIFPKTGHPPTDPAEWRQVFAAVQAHGLNHVRFHSWCPPEAAFVAADEMGLYLQVEVATWPNWSTTLGDGKPVDAWVEAETERIRRAYGNHPSFVLFCAGNEPSGRGHERWLADWVRRQRLSDPRRLHTAGAGWPMLPENEFHVHSTPRIQHWEEGLASRINALPPETATDYTDFIRQQTAPVVSHEIGQWCVYPNFAEMPKYTGYLKPRNFEIYQATLAAAGMADQARDYLMASGKLQALCYKEDIESALRTPEMGGFQLLGLQDFPGQGTALVGIVDPFWETKGYIAPAEFRRFCHSTVPLARLERRVFTQADELTAVIEVAHFGAEPIAAELRWRLVGTDDRVAASGTLPKANLAIGLTRVGRLEIPLGNVPAPAQYRLEVELPGTEFANDWDIWVYPPVEQVAQPVPDGVLVVSRLNAGALRHLEAGGAVWLMADPRHVKPDARRGPIALGFSSIFWNTSWTKGQAPHTLGILCDPAHPALAQFPTESHSNWQWWYPVTSAAPMILDGLPREFRPVVQVIDDWFTNRKLGLVFEARVGRGRLLVSSIDLRDGALDPVRRQLRASLLAYVASPDFKPADELPPEAVQAIFAP